MVTPLEEAFEQLQRLKDFGAEWLLVYHSPAVFSLAVKNANEIGFKPNITTFHWSLWEPIIESLGPLSDGLILNNAWIPWGAMPEHAGMKKLMAIHQKAGRKEPHTVHYTLGYIKAAITVEALRQTGENLAAVNIKNAFERVRNFEVDGLAPPSQADLVRRALREGRLPRALRDELRASAERRTS